MGAEEAAGFESLVRLTDAEIEALLREVDHKDLVIALKDLDHGPNTLRHGVLFSMSQRVRLFVLEELEFAKPTAQEIADAQTRIFDVARDLGGRGTICWPPGSGKRVGGAEPEPAPEIVLPSELLELVRAPLDKLSFDEIRRMLHGMASLAEEHGVLLVEKLLGSIASDYLDHGIRLTVDGVESPLLEDMLLVRAKTLVRELEVRLSGIIEGMASIVAGDNPRLVEHKLNSIYGSNRSGPWVMRPGERGNRWAYRDTAVSWGRSEGAGWW